MRRMRIGTFFMAHSLAWPEVVWTLLLQSVLKGKAQETYQLSVTQSAYYQTVKKAILKSYELVPEAYRKKFCNQRKADGVTYVEFAREKEDMFNKWCTSVGAQDYDNLRNLMLVEEFKRCLPSEIKIFLDEHKAKTLDDAATLESIFLCITFCPFEIRIVLRFSRGWCNASFAC
jgi:hypothetical protein